MEGLIQLIIKARAGGSLSRVHVARDLYITHLLFVDDILLFGKGSKEEWVHFHAILENFCDASGLAVNASKSSFLYQCDDPSLCDFLIDLFPYKLVHLDEGMWYLGFFIKPASYGWRDWLWLIK